MTDPCDLGFTYAGEMCGSKDPDYKIKLFEAFFEHFEKADQELVVD